MSHHKLAPTKCNTSNFLVRVEHRGGADRKRGVLLGRTRGKYCRCRCHLGSLLSARFVGKLSSLSQDECLNREGRGQLSGCYLCIIYSVYTVDGFLF